MSKNFFDVDFSSGMKSSRPAATRRAPMKADALDGTPPVSVDDPAIHLVYMEYSIEDLKRDLAVINLNSGNAITEDQGVRSIPRTNIAKGALTDLRLVFNVGDPTKFDGILAAFQALAPKAQYSNFIQYAATSATEASAANPNDTSRSIVLTITLVFPEDFMRSVLEGKSAEEAPKQAWEYIDKTAQKLMKLL